MKFIKDIRTKNYCKKQNVNGVAWKPDPDGRITFFVTEKLPKDQIARRDMVPKRIWRGYRFRKTNVVHVGEVKAHAYTKRHRPLEGGIEIAPLNKKWTGTLGIRVKRRLVYHSLLRNGPRELVGVSDWMKVKLGDALRWQYYGLTNRHVVEGADEFVQPLSGNTPVLELAEVGRWGLDCALVKPKGHIEFDDTIVGLGEVLDVDDAVVGELHFKHGRTTGLTQGECVRRDVSMLIDFGDVNRTLHGLDQFEYMSAPGDSGSVILDVFNNACTLLNSGSSVATFGIPMKKVLKELKVIL